MPPTGPRFQPPSLVVREHDGEPFYEAKFRSRRPAGEAPHRAGVADPRIDSGSWVPRRGRVADGYFDERTAHVHAAEIVAQYVADVAHAVRARRTGAPHARSYVPCGSRRVPRVAGEGEGRETRDVGGSTVRTSRSRLLSSSAAPA